MTALTCPLDILSFTHSASTQTNMSSSHGEEIRNLLWLHLQMVRAPVGGPAMIFPATSSSMNSIPSLRPRWVAGCQGPD